MIVKNVVEFLNLFSEINVLFVGFDVFLVMCYWDEYVLILKEDCGDFKVEFVYEWF